MLTAIVPSRMSGSTALAWIPMANARARPGVGSARAARRVSHGNEG